MYHLQNRITFLDFRFGLQWLSYLSLAKAKLMAAEVAKGAVRIQLS
jgi:hypothetical protein